MVEQWTNVIDAFLINQREPIVKNSEVEIYSLDDTQIEQVKAMQNVEIC